MCSNGITKVICRNDIYCNIKWYLMLNVVMATIGLYSKIICSNGI